MKHRLGILFIVLLIGLDLSGTYLDSTSKANLKSKIALAISYYKEKAWFYYRRFTGEIPPQIVINNPREWSRFSQIGRAHV